MSSSVNSKIMDSVMQTSAAVVGDAPAIAVGMLYQSMAHATGLALANATSNQQNLNQLNTSIIAQAIATIQNAPPAKKPDTQTSS